VNDGCIIHTSPHPDSVSTMSLLDDIVDCGKGVQTQEIKIVPLWLFNSRSIFSTKY